LPIQNESPHAPFFLPPTAESNGAMKTSKNYFKLQDEALNTYFSLLTIGTSGEDALRHWNRRPGFVAQF